MVSMTFEPPPPEGPFAPPPPKDAYARTEGIQGRGGVQEGWDGGRARGLDMMVAVMVVGWLLHIWYLMRLDGPMGGVFALWPMLRLMALWPFWVGKNWARVLTMGSCMLSAILSAFAVFAHFTSSPFLLGRDGLFVTILVGVLDVAMLLYLLRPDVVAFFERRGTSSLRK